MVVTAATTSLPPLPILKYHAIGFPIKSSLFILPSPRTNCIPRLVIPPRAAVIRPISATPDGVFLLAEASSPENTDQIVSTASDNGDGVSIVISVLLSIAFVGLSVLTIGVIYIAVTDFLQKREKDKFEKEEAEKAKKGGKKKRVRARAGPKGFGQKIESDDDFDL
ncbi:uncharacterized protein LOC111907268 [Lactuca sativa]|uniref:Uncharacterized protein n=1 Tax=Lactuca sativa TaxID=4236 RepID=A0A9R1VGM0_LACSA|nr:uncharacterized protein LOC111907268 [Lactuca sativa]KAJ0206812.1 hypothetical protein LSAT_V11C500290780 [Lactuca sativa]